MGCISFVVPVYNTPAQDLINCISSIISITNWEYEVVVVDDGSREELMCQYDNVVKKLNNARIKLIHQTNGGVSSARNTGIAYAKGDYIFFLDSDDTIMADVLCENFDADVVLFDYVMCKGKQRIVRSVVDHSNRRITYCDMLWSVLQDRLCACRHLYKREFLQKNAIKFMVGHVQGEDAEFNLLCAKAKPSVHYVNRVLYCYNYSAWTAMNRWKNKPDVIIENDEKRYKEYSEYVKIAFPNDYEWREKELAAARIKAIYRDAVALCSAGRATKERKAKIEQMMRQIDVSGLEHHTVAKYYLLITRRNWAKISVVAKLRICYLWIRRI